MQNHHEHPDYNAKLDRIIELLQQYFTSGGSNEGVVGEIEDLLNSFS
jgi:hypothetical protein